ncbi:putative baseplate assembly protein [Paenibacillus sp. MWE-103]|uniref:Baseplate assembly protein n=1 Tax=Paenibacillus artemisiicola TaxID=1172618 RepID=A0ABS3W5K9_9BACL|nr:putative baseplate assembly protein [Paenibacillus artemisiicola]MBO7743578.1 putative baseplate assembly protein [Paenibacillus artemisiicola]
MKAPLIDARDLNAIFKEMRELAPFFAPEWTPDSDRDTGTAVMDIFARMYGGILERLNRVPDKNFIAFLNRLGIKLLPASQARGPVTFALSSGAIDPVTVPSRTQVAAQPTGGGKPFVFETERTIVATPAKLMQAMTYYPKQDRLAQADSALLGAHSGDPFELFSESDLQTHALYIGHADLFNMTSQSVIVLDFSETHAGAARQLARLAQSQTVLWQYGTEDGWSTFAKALIEEGRIHLDTGAWTGIAETAVNGLHNRWIRAIVQPNRIKDAELVQFGTLAITMSNVLPHPDMAFANNVPQDVGKNDYYPFGLTPRLYDAFYVSSKEAFSKKGATITLSFTLKHETDWLPTRDTPAIATAATAGEKVITAQLSWEYWNGQGWMRIGNLNEDFPITADETGESGRPVTLTFTIPSAMSETVVQGQPGYWIRCKIAGGHYGKEAIVGRALVPRFYVPRISDLNITYAIQSERAERIVTCNNLEYRDRTSEIGPGGRPIQPFYRLADAHPALYLGFDTPPLKGPVSVYFRVQDQEYSEADFPRLEWEYYRVSGGKKGWTRLDVRDGTRHLTQSGCVEFVGAPDFAVPDSLFGTSLYWLRAIDAEDRFRPIEPQKDGLSQSSGRRHSARVKNDDTCGCGCDSPEPCGQFALFDPRFSSTAGGRRVPSPLLNGIFLNTTMASQSESIIGEILGSGQGLAGSSYALAKFPVLDEQVFVNELGALSDEEQAALRANRNVRVREEKDDAGVTTAFWVGWTAVDNLSESGEDSRHYEIDRTFGTVQFGNGIHGKVPPVGSDNIAADYQAGGGSAGNIGAGELGIMRTSIAYLDRPNNPYAYDCGYDTEPLSHALERGPLKIRTRNRAVTAADYEQLALEASRGIARAKCLPNFNDKGERETGWVTVLIVPQSSDAKPVPAPPLRQQAEAYLRSRAANVAAYPRHIKVFGPVYAEVSVSAELIASSFDAMPAAETEAYRNLTAYLHPLTGGKDGRGWDFGELPCLGELYSLFEADRNVDHVEGLAMTIRDPASGTTIHVTPNTSAAIRSVPYMLIYSGEHKLVVSGLAISS